MTKTYSDTMKENGMDEDTIATAHNDAKAGINSQASENKEYKQTYEFAKELNKIFTFVD